MTGELYLLGVHMSQIGIVIFGATAIFLVGCKKWEYQRWGYVCGLCAQPFWYWTTYEAAQWGIFGMSIFYTYSWFRGFRNHFFKEQKCG